MKDQTIHKRRKNTRRVLDTARDTLHRHVFCNMSVITESRTPAYASSKTKTRNLHIPFKTHNIENRPDRNKCSDANL